MGAWGTGTFENDTACDWAGDLESATDCLRVLKTLSRVIEIGDDSWTRMRAAKRLLRARSSRAERKLGAA